MHSIHCAFKSVPRPVAISVSSGSVLILHSEEMCVDVKFGEGLPHPEGYRHRPNAACH
jgi:hypothetical protein